MLAAPDDLFVGELEWDLACQHQLIDPFRIDAHLRRRPVPSVSEYLDHHRCAGNVEIDANERVSPATHHLLRERLGEAGLRDETLVFALQPTVAAPARLAPFHRGEQFRDPVAPLGAEVVDALMEELLGGETIAQRAVDGGVQLIDRCVPGEVDEGA